MTADVENKNSKAPPFLSFRSKRFKIVLMIAFSFLTQGMMRTNVGMAMVCMVNSTAIQDTSPSMSSSISESHCAVDNQTVERAHIEYDGSYVWSTEEQSSIFAAFFWGGLVSVFLSTWFSNTFGPSRVLLWAAIINVIGSFLTPTAADLGIYYLIVLRVIMGFAQGVVYTLGATIVAAWLPVQDRSTATAIYTNGNQISYVFSMLFSSQLCQATAIGGWRSIFYLYGALGGVMCVLWWWIVTDTPHDDKDITEAEFKHIVGNVKQKPPTVSTPWLKLLTSPSVLTLVMCMFGSQLTINVLNTYLPQYFKYVLHMDLTSNGIWSALPFICQTMMKFISGWMADALKAKFPKRMELITKGSQTISTFGTAICLLLIYFVGCGQDALAVALISLSLSFLAFNIGGHFTCMISVAPLHTSALNTVVNVFGQTSSIFAPYMVGFIATENTSTQWMTVFGTMSAIQLVAGISFILFGTLKPIKWSRINDANTLTYSVRKRTGQTTIY